MPVDAAVVAKMRERDENMAFKCSGELSPFACSCICQGEVDINRAPAPNWMHPYSLYVLCTSSTTTPVVPQAGCSTVTATEETLQRSSMPIF